jgi:hypothetical protein
LANGITDHNANQPTNECPYAQGLGTHALTPQQHLAALQQQVVAWLLID